MDSANIVLKSFAFRWLTYCRANGINIHLTLRIARERFGIKTSYNVLYNASKGIQYRPITLYTLCGLCEVVNKPLSYFISEE